MSNLSPDIFTPASETNALKNKIVNMDRIVSQLPASTESLRNSL